MSLKYKCFYIFNTVQISVKKKKKILYLKASFLHASAGFEVGANAFTSSLLELWKLAAAGLNDGLDLLFWLLGDGHHPVQILIHK